MKKFGLKVFQVLAIVMALNFAIYFVLNNYTSSRFNEYYKMVSYIQSSEYEVLVTGDSHANAFWRLNNSDEVLNFTFPGDNYLDILRKLKYLENKGVKIKNHLVEVDEHMFNDYRAKTNNNDLSLYFENGEMFVKAQLYFPLFFNSEVSGKILSVFKKDEVSENGGGEITLNSMNKRVDSQYKSKKVSIEMKENFDAILKISQEIGSEVVFIKYPIFSDYLAICDTVKSYRLAKDFLKNRLEGTNYRTRDFTNFFKRKCIFLIKTM